MVKKSKGFRARTRKRLKQKLVRPTITKFLQKFEIGQRVIIAPEPLSPRAMPHPRFKGAIGEVVESKGKAYIVKILNGKKEKKIIVAPEHLRGIK